MHRQRNETADELRNIASERRTLFNAFTAARSALAAWRVRESTATARFDNETSQREGMIKATKQRLNGEVERAALLARTYLNEEKAADAALEAVKERRIAQERSMEKAQVEAALALRQQASGAEESHTNRERVYRQVERSSLEQSAALQAQVEGLSGDVESLRSRRDALKADVVAIKVRVSGLLF